MDLTHDCIYPPTSLGKCFFVNLTEKVSNDDTLEAPGNYFLRLLIVISLFLRYVSGSFDFHKPHQLRLIVNVNLMKKLLFMLMEYLDYVRAYPDDLLGTSKLSLEDHQEKLEEVLRQLRDVGLKVNADKSTFCTLEIEYLGYVLTRDKIKPKSNKVQAILTGVTQLLHFLGMVQYYHDLWARQSEMLTPLTSLVEECGQTKTSKAKGTKKVPWHWDEVHQRAFNHVKATIAKDVILAYPDYSKVSEIYTDASSKQLGVQ